MSAGGQGGLPPATVPIRELLKDAAIWALVTLGLCFPLIAFRTEQNVSHQPVLDARPWLVAFFVVAVFAAVFCHQGGHLRAAERKGHATNLSSCASW